MSPRIRSIDWFLMTKNAAAMPTHSSKGISAAFEQMPGLLNKFIDMKSGNDMATEEKAAEGVG